MKLNLNQTHYQHLPLSVVRHIRPGSLVLTQADEVCLVIKKGGCFPSLVNIANGKAYNDSTYEKVRVIEPVTD